MKTVKGLSTYSYTYDADGRRLTQTVPWIGKISYYYTGSELTKLTVQSHTLTFTYDNLGVESVDYDGTMYYYLRNAQGDITGIVDTSGNVVTEYVYDAWGNVISTTGSKSTTVGKFSPFRYRGYIYDDSGLYYLKTRYYDPAMGRFVCADGYASTGVGLLGTNSFAYCNNNPAMMKDGDGSRPVVGMSPSTETKDEREASFKYMKELRKPKKKPINGQDTAPFSDIKYGRSTIGYSGCEAIATYNALILTGIDVGFQTIKYDFLAAFCNYVEGFGLFGFFGATPNDIAMVLSNYGVSYGMMGLKKLEEIKTPGVFIVSYWNGDSIFDGYHTIAIDYDGYSYTGYNWNCGKNKTYTFDGVEDFIGKRTRYICGFYITK